MSANNLSFWAGKVALGVTILFCIAMLGACSVRSDEASGKRVLARGLGHPCAIGLDRRGNIYVAGADRVRMITDDGDVIPVAKGMGRIGGMAVQKHGGVYISLPEAGKVVWITPVGVHETVAEGLDEPRALCIDRFGRLLIVEAGAGRVVMMHADGSVESVGDAEGVRRVVDCQMGLVTVGADGLQVRTGLGMRSVRPDCGLEQVLLASSPLGRAYVAALGDGRVWNISDRFESRLCFDGDWEAACVAADRDRGLVVATMQGELLRVSAL